ncbi:ABC transporter ATP-binding protein [Planctomycetota bacterium]
MTDLVKLSSVTKTYPSPTDAPAVEVLKSLSLEINAGERVGIVGPSGSGKSSLLNIIGALDQATDGTVMFGDKDLNSLSEDELAAFRSGQIGFVFQLHHLLPQCTVLENVLIPILADGVSSEGGDARAVKLLERVGLADRRDHRPAELSGGERQRVAVVRALINKPQLLCADEPTGSLDHGHALDLVDLLIELSKEEEMALAMVTHSRELAGKMDRVLELKDGNLSASA